MLAVYEESKLRLGRLDFLDLLVRARNLLRENNSVRADLQKRFTHLFVDEFQDTDPIQAEILLLLACGDPSISDWEHAIPEPGETVYRGRSETGGLPISAGRCGSVSTCQGSLGIAWRAVHQPNDQLSRETIDPEIRQRCSSNPS